MLTGCGGNEEGQAREYQQFASFRDVPGVTEAEISAIDELRVEYGAFVYGALASAEAFLDENGVVSGYAALVCEWLSRLFDIPFTPILYEWGELINGLESGKISFTSELSNTGERRDTYYFTSVISERLIKQVRLTDSEPFHRIAALRPIRYAFLKGADTYGIVSGYIYSDFEAVFACSYDLLG